jgi:hypothetical protein
MLLPLLCILALSCKNSKLAALCPQPHLLFLSMRWQVSPCCAIWPAAVAVHLAWSLLLHAHSRTCCELVFGGRTAAIDSGTRLPLLCKQALSLLHYAHSRTCYSSVSGDMGAPGMLLPLPLLCLPAPSYSKDSKLAALCPQPHLLFAEF